MNDEKIEANVGYALDQVNRAHRTAEQHEDPAVRQRAREKIERWAQVVSGMLDGNLEVGSRTPIANTPPWVTLEVVNGFAAGNYEAGGPLLPHENSLLARVNSDPGKSARHSLNTHYVQQLMKVREWKPQLWRIKKCAYAWRQMVFYLSFLDQYHLDAFLVWYRKQIAKLPHAVRARLTPAFDGLLLVARGGVFGEDGMGPNGERRFLGWTTERHWLLEQNFAGSEQ